MAAVPKPALHPLTADDRGALIIIIAYSWVFISVLAATIRFGLAWSHKLHLKKDDVAFALGVVFAVASSVCFHVASSNGLGRRMALVASEDLGIYYKSMYAGELLSLTAQWFAKVSFLQLSDRIAPRKSGHYNIVFGTIIFWGIFSVLSIALECGLPRPWIYTPETCPTKGYFYYPVIIMNIITDVILATWILPTLWKLLMDADRRILVVLLFGSRLIVTLCAAAQLVTVARHIRDPDVTYESFGRVLWALCVMHLSVLQATVPRTKRFIAALQLRTHATVRLTDFELKLPTKPRGSTMPSKYVDKSFGSSEATASNPEPAHPPSTSPAPSLRRSDSRPSTRSEQPLVPLQLTPSNDQCISTEIVAHGDDAPRRSKRYDANDWKKYLRRSKQEDDMNVASMFSWKSRSSFAQERIVQTKEITQKVEVVQPKESKWTLKRWSQGEEARRESQG